MMNETLATIMSCKPVHIHFETEFSTRMQSKFILASREKRAILQTMKMLSTQKKQQQQKKNENTTKRKMTN